MPKMKWCSFLVNIVMILLEKEHNHFPIILGNKGIPCPKPVRNVDGKRMSLETLKTPINNDWLENNGITSYNVNLKGWSLSV